ncbi:MAG: hypothetical protein DHS20C13_29860 [Thermodesulfobacteriota bacterium]|nr:MAG: hypothetical protein DHS20C13_29860 [Thermodesulfobacteriota bacterium]
MTLSWTPADTFEDSFDVLRTVSGGTQSLVATLAAGTTTYVDNNVLPETAY